MLIFFSHSLEVNLVTSMLIFPEVSNLTTVRTNELPEVSNLPTGIKLILTESE